MALMVEKLFVHRELAAGEPSGANAGNGGECLHFRARLRRRVGAVNQQNRSACPPGGVEKASPDPESRSCAEPTRPQPKGMSLG